MSPVDEGLIHAWLDGQLPPDEAARVDALVASDPAWRDAAAEARGLLAASARILGALDDAPAVRPIASAPSVVRAPQPWYAAAWLKAAAGVVLIAGVASVTWKRTPEDIRVPTSEMAATTTDAVPESVAMVVPASPVVTPPPVARDTARREVRVAAPPPAPPTAQKATAEITSVTSAGAGAGGVGDIAGRAAADASRRTVSDTVHRDSAIAQRAVMSAPPVPLVERGFGGGRGGSTLGEIPSACWYPLTERNTLDSAAVVQLAALPMVRDSMVATRWQTEDGVTVTFTGRLTGDTLIGRVRESAGDIRRLPRDLKLVRGVCRRDE